jgi:hypothetical protein
MINQRKLISLAIHLVAAMFLIVIVGYTLWLYLPIYYPMFVLKHSPWIDPYVRAIIRDRDAPEMPHYPQITVEKLRSKFPEPVVGLVNMLGSSDPKVCSRAAALLCDVGDSRAIPALSKLVSNSDPSVRACAISALIAIDSEGFRAQAEAALNDPNPFVCVVVRREMLALNMIEPIQSLPQMPPELP